MKKLNNAYIAGFVDGEAYIGLMKRRTKQSPRPFIVKPTVKIAQIEQCREVLDCLKERYGGYISKTREHKNSRPSVMWELSNLGSIHQIMLDIRPYAVVKLPLIELMLEYCHLPKQTNSLSDANNAIQLEKERIQCEMAKLTRRGLAETE